MSRDELNDFVKMLIEHKFKNVDKVLVVSEDGEEFLITEANKDGMGYLTMSLGNELDFGVGIRANKRGRFLDAFLTLEFIVNMLLSLELEAYKTRRSLELLEILMDSIPFEKRLQALYSMKAIDKSLFTVLNNLRLVRNDLAHKLDIDRPSTWRGRPNRAFKLEDINADFKDGLKRLLIRYSQGQETYVAWLRARVMEE